ncbi:MAG: DUF1294 domain-containing protein [Clostridia bacterium]|nr:DUF1294 domain-containing protein [Clostridia bacterium]
MLIYYLIFLAVMSVIAFILYGADKSKAQKKAWRTPESVLLGFGFFGGAIGAIAGMNIFRHKTKHWYFWVVNIAGLLVQAVLAVLIYVKL